MISLKQIRYALAVGKYLHFRKAAEACTVSQSALSTALSELEKQLGVTIFERDNKKVLITATGQTLLNDMQRIQTQVQDLMVKAELSGNKQGLMPSHLKIGMIPTICPYLLPRVLPGVEQQFPTLKLQVIEQQSHQLLEQVRTGLIDAAVLALPYEHEGLLSFEFWQENFVWVAHKDYIALTAKALTSTDLQHMQLMLLGEGHCLKDHILAVCQLQANQKAAKQSGEQVDQQALTATSLTTLIQLVLAKQGTTLVPEIAQQALTSSQDQLITRPLAEPGPHRRLAFIVRPNYAGLPAIEQLMQNFQTSLQKVSD